MSPTHYGHLWQKLSEHEREALTAVSNKFDSLVFTVGRHGIVASKFGPEMIYRIQMNGQVKDILSFSVAAIESIAVVTLEDVHREIKS
jgi:hypothetical protein